MKIRLLIFLLSLFPIATALAEWRTESYSLKAGWNAIYPGVDASYTTLDVLLARNPDILEVWRWQPERVDPRLPGDVAKVPVGIEWSVWKAGVPEETTFDRLSANYGYLVKLADGALQQTLAVKGRAALPEVRWRGDGLQLTGFPVNTSGTKPTLSAYLAPTGFALGSTEILRYVGGPIAPGSNPAAAVPSVTQIVRGQAYWIRVNNFSRYYGPLKVETDSGTQINFGADSNNSRLVLTNLSTNSLSFTLATAPSESAPSGQKTIAGDVPLLCKTDADTAYAPLSSRTFTLSAGGSIAVRLAVNRAGLSGPAGAYFSSLLLLKTTAGITGEEVYLPVTAEVGSLAGLWIGEADIGNVGSILRRYERDADGKTVYDAAGNPKIIEDLTTPGSGDSLPGVSKPYPLRVILHVDASGQATLLSHVYEGRLAAAPPEEPTGLVTSEALLDPTDLRNAVRLSVAHLPLDTKLALGGSFSTGGTLANASSLITAYNAAENPFVHSYHPDHDNLDARFKTVLPAGRESFDIERRFTFAIDATPPSSASASWGTTEMTGTYSEIIEGPYKSPIRVQGTFSLYKVSDIPVLTTR